METGSRRLSYVYNKRGERIKMGLTVWYTKNGEAIYAHRGIFSRMREDEERGYCILSERKK
jgi:hypothetical protein